LIVEMKLMTSSRPAVPTLPAGPTPMEGCRGTRGSGGGAPPGGPIIACRAEPPKSRLIPSQLEPRSAWALPGSLLCTLARLGSRETCQCQPFLHFALTVFFFGCTIEYSCCVTSHLDMPAQTSAPSGVRSPLPQPARFRSGCAMSRPPRPGCFPVVLPIQARDGAGDPRRLQHATERSPTPRSTERGVCHFARTKSAFPERNP
jgi:hypothetical protein